MPLARVNDEVALRPRRFEQRPDRLDRRAGQRNVVTHRIDIPALAAEVGLHVDDDDRGVLRPPVAVVRPGIGIGVERRQGLVLISPSTILPACRAPIVWRSTWRS